MQYIHSSGLIPANAIVGVNTQYDSSTLTNTGGTPVQLEQSNDGTVWFNLLTLTPKQNTQTKLTMTYLKVVGTSDVYLYNEPVEHQGNTITNIVINPANGNTGTQGQGSIDLSGYIKKSELTSAIEQLFDKPIKFIRYILNTFEHYDTDGDGLLDYDEVVTHNTDPQKSDSDDDGYQDSVEVAKDTNPNDASDFPSVTIDEIRFETGEYNKTLIVPYSKGNRLNNNEVYAIIEGDFQIYLNDLPYLSFTAEGTHQGVRKGLLKFFSFSNYANPIFEKEITLINLNSKVEFAIMSNEVVSTIAKQIQEKPFIKGDNFITLPLLGYFNNIQGYNYDFYITFEDDTIPPEVLSQELNITDGYRYEIPLIHTPKSIDIYVSHSETSSSSFVKTI